MPGARDAQRDRQGAVNLVHRVEDGQRGEHRAALVAAAGYQHGLIITDREARERVVAARLVERASLDVNAIAGVKSAHGGGGAARVRIDAASRHQRRRRAGDQAGLERCAGPHQAEGEEAVLRQQIALDMRMRRAPGGGRHAS